MPKFETHITVSSLLSAFAVVYGTARYGWNPDVASVAFVAGAAGGMVPDLDSDQSKPLRLSGAIVGLAAAAGVWSFASAPGPLLNRPWPAGSVALAALGAYFIFNTIFIEILRRNTRHRGLFHSLATPFLYGGVLACLAAPYGGAMPIAVWSVGSLGALSHLVLDAAQSMSFDPLKIKSHSLAAATRLWVATAIITLIAFTRLTKF